MNMNSTLLELLRIRFQAIVDEMGYSILHTGHTVFIKETGDFGTALVSATGEVIAAPIRIGMIRTVGMPMDDAVRASAPFEDGDIFMSNDPKTTGGMSTHLPDVFVWKPVFDRAGEFLCFAWTFIHMSDVGGMVPGSITPSAREIFQEGLILPPVRLYGKGVLNEDVLRIFLANTRIPDLNWGDLKAALSALHLADQRLKELAAQYGAEVVVSGQEELLEHAHRLSRKVISQVPDGHYEFADYLEGSVENGHPQCIYLTLKVAGEELYMDFTGTDPQARNGFNVPSYGKRGHYYVVAGLVNYLRTMEAAIPYNSGMIRNVHTQLPRGSLLHPEPEAAVGTRAATMHRVNDAFLGCMAQAVSGKIPAAGAGGATIVLVSTQDPRTGRSIVSVVEPITGGGGARPHGDGVDGTDAFSSSVRNIPVEVLEQEVPLQVVCYGLRPGSAGAGRFRGGHGIEMEIRLLSHDAQVTARGMERHRFRPWGLEGGRPGELGVATLNRGTPRECDLGRFAMVEMSNGETLYFGGQGGGGYGSPLERDPEDVLADVASGLLTESAATDVYGVVIRDGHVDERLTAERRRIDHIRKRNIDYGPERERWDRYWPPALQKQLMRLVASVPGHLQARLAVAVRARYKEELDAGRTPMLEEIYQQVLSSLSPA